MSMEMNFHARITTHNPGGNTSSYHNGGGHHQQEKTKRGTLKIPQSTQGTAGAEAAATGPLSRHCRTLTFSKWVSLAAGIVLAICSGTLYLFGIYSDDLKANLKYTQTQTELVASFLNIGTWSGLFGGLFYDAYGPRWTIVVGGVLVSGGYFLMYAMVDQVITGSYILLALFALVVGQGSAWLYTAALNTTAFNFPTKHRGKVVGILSCFDALSAGIFTQTYASSFEPHVEELFFFFTIAFAVAAASSCILTNKVTIASRINAAQYDMSDAERLAQIERDPLALLSEEAGGYGSTFSSGTMRSHAAAAAAGTPFDESVGHHSARLHIIVVYSAVIAFYLAGTSSILLIESTTDLKRSFMIGLWCLIGVLLFVTAIPLCAKNASFFWLSAADYNQLENDAAVGIDPDMSSDEEDDERLSSSLSSVHRDRRAAVASAASDRHEDVLTASMFDSDLLSAVAESHMEDGNNGQSSGGSGGAPLSAADAAARAADAELESALLEWASEENEEFRARFEEVAGSHKVLLQTVTVDTVYNIDLTFWEVMCTAEGWLLWVAFTLSVGSGIMYIQSVGNLLKSLGGASSATKNNLVILLSISNSAGRIFFGMASDSFSKYLSRPSFLVLPCFMLCAALLYLAYATVAMLYFGSAVLGVAYGGLFCLVPTLTSEFFGMRNFGANFGLISTGPGLGSYLISTVLAGKLYEYFADKQAGNNPLPPPLGMQAFGDAGMFADDRTFLLQSNIANDCLGTDCYHYTFLIAAGLSFVAAMAAVALSYLYRVRADARISKARVHRAIREPSSLLV